MSGNAVFPAGWTETTVGKVVANLSINEKKLPKGRYLESGRFPVVDQGQQFIGGYSDDQEKVVSEDLPVLVFGDHTRVFKFLDQPFVPGADGVKVLKPLGVNAKWLYQIAHALDFPNKGYARHFQHLKAAKLLVPPLPEQRRIVAEIEKQFTRLEAGVAALRRVQANLKRYRAAVLKAACEGRLVPTEAELQKSEGRGQKSKTQFETGAELLARILTERRKNWQGRGKYKVPAAPDTANLPPLLERWTWATVEQLLVEPMCNGISIKGSNNPPGIRTMRLSAMSNSGFDYSDARYLPLSESDVDDLWIQPKDFFVSRGNGSLHLVGRGTFAQPAPFPTIFPDTMIRLRLAQPVRTTRWIPSIWPSYLIRSQIERKVKTTAGIYKIAQPQVGQIFIPLPPLAEQTRIVAEVERRLSVVEEVESVVSANLQRAVRLRQSILQKAFTGQL